MKELLPDGRVRRGADELGIALAVAAALTLAACGARLVFASGMPGVAVPIRDASARRLYDAGEP